MRRMLQGRAGMGMAFIIGLLVATAGTATAARLITGKQIKNGSITAKDLSPSLLNQIARGGPAGPAGPRGDQGAVGQRGVDGPSGTARAYAYVSPACTAQCPLSRAKNIVSVTREQFGHYCITAAAGIDPADAPLLVGVDFAKTDGPEGRAVALSDSTSADGLCSKTQYSAWTLRIDTAGSLTSNSVGFWIAVP